MFCKYIFLVNTIQKIKNDDIKTYNIQLYKLFCKTLKHNNFKSIIMKFILFEN